ncbi:hypothetical protein MRX96_022892 [Rhipicephalus microplus]
MNSLHRLPVPALEARGGQRALDLTSRASLGAGPRADLPDRAVAIPSRGVRSKPVIRTRIYLTRAFSRLSFSASWLLSSVQRAT